MQGSGRSGIAALLDGCYRPIEHTFVTRNLLFCMGRLPATPVLAYSGTFGHIETKTLRPSLTQEPVIKEFYALHNKTSANVSKLIAMHSSILIFQSFQSPEYFLSQVSCHLWMLLPRNPYKPHLQDFVSDVSGYLPLHNCMSGDEIIYILPIQHLLRNTMGPKKTLRKNCKSTREQSQKNHWALVVSGLKSIQQWISSLQPPCTQVYRLVSGGPLCVWPARHPVPRESSPFGSRLACQTLENETRASGFSKWPFSKSQRWAAILELRGDFEEASAIFSMCKCIPETLPKTSPVLPHLATPTKLTGFIVQVSPFESHLGSALGRSVEK